MAVAAEMGREGVERGFPAQLAGSRRLAGAWYRLEAQVGRAGW